MKYKLLGPYIEQVKGRNKDALNTNLMGVSIAKRFIPSIANTIGTDLSTYRIVHPGDFAFCPVTSRNGEKITIARYKGEDDCIISQAYTPFRVIDENELDPDYLMMWFRRPEFDRYARFHSHGSVREIFSWEEMCNVSLPIPDIDEQRKIVAEYQTIEKRIENNNRLIKVLEETAQNIYYHTFVENIDPENLPEGWKYDELGNVCQTYLGGTPSRDNPDFWGGNIAWINSGEINKLRILKATEYITNLGMRKSATKLLPIHTVVLALTGATLGQVSILEIETCANQSVVGVVGTDELPYQYIYPYITTNIRELTRKQTGGAQQHVNKNDIESFKIPIPPKELIIQYLKKVDFQYEYIRTLSLENMKLEDVKLLLIEKLS